jgi:hypothetical protein
MSAATLSPQPRRDLALTLCQLDTVLGVRLITPSEPKVADLELAVGVDEQISGFQVAVYNVG